MNQNQFEKYKIFFEERNKLFIKEYFSNELDEKITYMFEGGKHLRGILCLIFLNININDYINKPNNYCLDISILIELIHCFSLVIDDTPIMDNDETRRNKPSFFKKYGETYTNYFIYYFINKLMIIIYKIKNKLQLDNKQTDDSKLNEIFKLVTKNMMDLINGQILDVNYNSFNGIDDCCNGSLTVKEQILNTLLNRIENIIEIELSPLQKTRFVYNLQLNILKTSSLFNLAIYFPYLLNKHINHDNHNSLDSLRSLDENDKINEWSLLLGIMFQYSDDLLDIEQDKINKKPNICLLLDTKIVKLIVFKGCDYLANEINNYNLNINLIKIILSKIKNRVNEYESTRSNNIKNK